MGILKYRNSSVKFYELVLCLKIKNNNLQSCQINAANKKPEFNLNLRIYIISYGSVTALLPL